MKKKGLFSAVGLSLMFCGILAFGVYSGIEEPDETDDGVYKLTDIAMNVEVDEGYSGKVLTSSPVLVIHGDKKKVKKMRKAETIPEVVIDMKKKKSGEYVGVPKVKDKLFKVNYSFQPSEIDVEVIEASEQDFNVLERDYGLTAEGMRVESIVADKKATLLITEEQSRSIGQVLAEVNVEGMKLSTEEDADVIVLDKRGDIMEDVEVVTKTIPVYVSIEPMGWYQTTRDIEDLEDEISELDKELAVRIEQEKGVQDVLKKSDLNKEIDFRKKRLKTKNAELEEKRSGVAEAKKVQEAKKIEGVKESVRSGGRVEDDEEIEEGEE